METERDPQLLRLAKRLALRFREVPEFSEEEAYDYIEEAKAFEGIDEDRDIPKDKERLILLYAQSEVANSIAFRAAHYFKFTDGEESVDKSKVSHNYRQLAKDLRAEYDKEKTNVNGSYVTTMRRADRP